MWKKVLFILFSLIFLLSMFPFHPAMGEAPATTISVQPTQVFGLNVGDAFSININVANVVDLNVWQFAVFYQSAVLNGTAGSFVEGSFLHAGGVSTLSGVINFTDHYNSTFGIAAFYCARFSNKTQGERGVDGSGTLATFNFTAVGSGPSVLDFFDVVGGYPTTYLVDSNEALIPFTPVDGIAYVGSVDVAIGAIDAPLDIPQGSMALINVTAQNRGQPTETFDVTLSTDSTVIGTQTVMNLLGGTNQILTFAWDTMSVSMGQYTLTATATTVVGEIDLSDNTLSVNAYVGTIDIAITGVSMKTSIPVGTDVTKVEVTAQNGGQATEAFNVTLSVGSQPVGYVTTTLDPGTSGAVTLLWNTTILGYGNYTVQVYIPPLPFQIDTTNNNFTTTAAITIAGDLNRDFKVSLNDLVILAQAYSSRPGDAKWNVNADIDGNGVVGLTDLVILATHYGQQFP